MSLSSVNSMHTSSDLTNFSDRYRDSSKRFHDYRRVVRAYNTFDGVSRWTRGARWDGVLCRPEAIGNPLVRSLISASRRLEELGEISADLSGFVEKYTFKVLGGGESFGFKKILSSAVARAISSLARIGPLNAFKIIGCGLFALSVLTGAAAIAINGGGLRQYQADKISRPSKSSVIKKSLQKRTAEFVSNNKLVRNLKESNFIDIKMCNLGNMDHLTQNKKNYSPVVRFLLNSSIFTFKVINKFFVSWDKHIAFHTGKLLAPHVGGLLGTRLTMCIFSGIAAALTIVMDPINLSLSLIGIAACGLAALLAATALALAERERRQVLGRVTPC